MIDRAGHQLQQGMLVLVPIDDYIPGKGHCFSFTVGTIEELFTTATVSTVATGGKQGMRGDMARVHTKWETVRVLCDRLVSLEDTDGPK